MNTVVRRIALGVITTVLFSTIVPSAPTAEAVSLGASSDFVIKAFPHTTPTVGFSDSWGAPRSGGRSHTGTDIMSPKGTPVVAVEDGIVESLRSGRLSGWRISIRHADGWTSHYLHLNNDRAGTDDGEGGADTAFAEDLEIGSFVKAGELIGYVGDSGNAEHTASHTHFELHKDGTKLDPYAYLVSALQRKLRASEIRNLIL